MWSLILHWSPAEMKPSSKESLFRKDGFSPEIQLPETTTKQHPQPCTTQNSTQAMGCHTHPQAWTAKRRWSFLPSNCSSDSSEPQAYNPSSSVQPLKKHAGENLHIEQPLSSLLIRAKPTLTGSAGDREMPPCSTRCFPRILPLPNPTPCCASRERTGLAHFRTFCCHILHISYLLRKPSRQAELISH